MFKNKIIFIISAMFILSSCAGTWDSVKRGLTGQKQNSTDEFLVKKKDPLILPPDYENLPTPSERERAVKEMSDFEKVFNTTSSDETISSSTDSTESSIIKKIQRQ
tara:strand:+ start:367 stop:684 length:318 start_codon:yes stop_codon:yes gene_type:complete